MIIIDSLACPFTVLLNVLVILAVKSRPVQAFIANPRSCLLVRLAVAYAISGLISQPTFIFATTLKLFIIRWTDFFYFSPVFKTAQRVTWQFVFSVRCTLCWWLGRDKRPNSPCTTITLSETGASRWQWLRLDRFSILWTGRTSMTD